MTDQGAASRWREAAWVGLVVAIALVVWNPAVPDTSECGYLLGAFRAGHPGFLAGDFTFGSQHPKTIAFDWLLGPFTRLVSLENLARAGRFLLLLGLVPPLFRIGKRAGLGDDTSALAVLAWLAFGQSIVGGETAALVLVPKTVSWVAGFWALDATLARRPWLAGLMLGLALTFHQSVGASLSLAIAAAMLSLRYRRRDWVWVVGLSALVALPTVIPAVGELAQPNTDLVAEWRFQALTRLPIHLDLGYFSKRSVVVLAAMLGFVVAGTRRSTNEALRALGLAAIAVTAIFLFGVAVTLLGRYDLLAVYPFRVAPVVIQWTFFVVAAAGYRAGWYAFPARLAPAALVAILLALPSPIDIAINGRFKHGTEESTPSLRDHRAALQWIRTSTPATATLVVSPIRRCTQYVSHRPQIVYGDLARLDRLREWRERYEAHFGGEVGSRTKGDLDEAFNRLDEPAIRRLVRAYGGDFLLSRGRYPFPVVHESGVYRVYDLSALERPIDR